MTHPADEHHVKQLLKTEADLPQDPANERIVLWKTFRSENEAVDYSRAIILEEDQHLVGGASRDSAGPLYWIGVQVEDLEAWGNSQAIQLTDPFDANDPAGQGRGIS